MSGLHRRTSSAAARTPLIGSSSNNGPDSSHAAAPWQLPSSRYAPAGSQNAMPYPRKLRVTRILRPVYLLGVAVLLVVLLKRSASSEGEAGAYDWTAYYDGITDSLATYGIGSGSMGKGKGKNATFGEFECNPFQQIGKLIVDEKHHRNTGWVPFDKRCKPSSYFRHLYRLDDEGPMIPASHVEGDEEEDFDGSDFQSPRRYLPWLQNRTILFIGDSIDRFVLKDMCEAAKGNLFNVHNEHPAAVAPYHQTHIPEFDENGRETAASRQRQVDRQALERKWDSRGLESQKLTNPWVCDLKEYGATLINVFTFGYEGGEEWFKNEHWYHGPASYVDRLHYIAKPLVKNLARYLDRPQIEHPDLITSHAVYWNLRKYAEEDFVNAGWTERPYPEDSPLVFTNMSPEREKVIEAETRKSLTAVARAFRGPDGRVRTGPTILWRSMHQTLRHNYAPWSRTFECDSLIRHLISEMQEESKHRNSRQEDNGFDERLRIDEFGPLMRGQQHLYRDLGHPNFIPGSWLRADILLYELKRALAQVDRSAGTKKKHW